MARREIPGAVELEAAEKPLSDSPDRRKPEGLFEEGRRAPAVSGPGVRGRQTFEGPDIP